MCGIAGIFNLNTSAPIDYSRLYQMAGKLTHRGPDELGFFIDDTAGLTSTRLKIIDLHGGTQPIHNEDENLWIVFNGEIFNYIELRNDLKKHHKFYTQTDTEVILHLYEEKGVQCLNDLNGEFAFAIYDKRKQILFIGRDRFGIRPFFFTISNNQFFFGSEIKSLLMNKNIKVKINPIAIDQIFTFWTTLPGVTAFENIYELPAGHYLNISNNNIKIARYWNLPFSPPEEHYKTDSNEISSNLYNLLLDSIRIRLRSDVPVGCYISGGLDSSAITSITKKNFNNNVSTFGICFEDNSYDETLFQKEIINYLNIYYSNVTVSNSEIGKLFPEAVWHCEKPILRTAPVPMLILSKLVHDSGLKVVLTGEGADEVFGGYDIFKETKARLFWAERPDSVIRSLLLKSAHPDNSVGKKLQLLAAEFYKKGLDNPDNIFFSHMIRWNNTSKIKNLFSQSMQDVLKDYNCYEDLKSYIPDEFRRWDYISKAQYLEIVLFLNNYLLSSQGDRVAMASSVETRLPYLDYRIVEYMSKVPANLKIKGMQEKYILRTATKNTLPPKIVYRKKYPYRAPIVSALLNSFGNDLRNMDFLKESEIFDYKKVQILINNLSRKNNYGELDGMALAGILSTYYLFHQFNTMQDNSANIPVKLLYDKRSKNCYV